MFFSALQLAKEHLQLIAKCRNKLPRTHMTQTHSTTLPRRTTTTRKKQTMWNESFELNGGQVRTALPDHTYPCADEQLPSSEPHKTRICPSSFPPWLRASPV